MRGMLALLSMHEEAALCKIGFGSDDPLESSHVRRLLQLELVEWTGGAWGLTPIGQQRYEGISQRRLEATTPPKDLGRPEGWTPTREIEHLIECPTCGHMINMRDLSDVLEHAGPHQAKQER